MQIIGARRRRRGHAAMGVTGGRQPEFARGRGIKQPRGQDALIDDGELLDRDALGVERLRAQAAPAQRIVDDPDVLCKQLLAHAVLEKTGLARDRGAIDRADQMADQRIGDPRIEDHRHLAGFDLARIGARHGALAGGAPDAFRRCEVGRHAAPRCSRSRAPCRCRRRRSPSSRCPGSTADRRRESRWRSPAPCRQCRSTPMRRRIW